MINDYKICVLLDILKKKKKAQEDNFWITYRRETEKEFLHLRFSKNLLRGFTYAGLPVNPETFYYLDIRRHKKNAFGFWEQRNAFEIPGARIKYKMIYSLLRLEFSFLDKIKIKIYELRFHLFLIREAYRKIKNYKVSLFIRFIFWRNAYRILRGEL